MSMKKAEELIEEFPILVVGDKEQYRQKYINFIKQIQLDAWREGMSEAAQLCEGLDSRFVRDPDTHFGRTIVEPSQYDCRNAISKAAKERTTV